MNALKVLAFFFFFAAAPLWGVTDYVVPIDAGSSARTARMGHIGGFTAQSEAVFDNPGALDRVNQFSGTLFTTTFMEEVVYQNLTAGWRTPLGVLGVGYMSAGVSGLLRTSIIWNPDTVNRDMNAYETYNIVASGNSFGYSNQLFKVAYQLSQDENISWGIGVTYYNTSISTVNGSGINVDIGGIFNFYPLIFSVSARNVIPGMGVAYSNGGRENLPLLTTYGVLYEWADFNIMGQLKVSDGVNKQILKSAGVNYRPEFLPLLSLSVGMREMAVLQNVKSSYTAGVGFDTDGMSFDYAYETSDNRLYNAKHYFSLGFAF